MRGLLLLVAAAVWPALGLVTKDARESRSLTPYMPSLFPEGRLPGSPSWENRKAKELFGDIKLPEVTNLARVCHLTGYGPTERYFNVKVPGLDESFALKQPSSRAAIIVMPGGGLSYLGWEREGTKVAEWLTSLNISAFVLKYRVPSQTHPDWSHMDAERAMSTVRSRAHEFGFDSDRIGVIGFSAGGGLASWVSASTHRSYARIDKIDDVPFKPNFQLLVYGNTPTTLEKGQYPPPTFMAHARDDPCVPQKHTEEYCQAIKSVAQQSCTRFLYPDGGHGVGVCTGQWAPGFPHTTGNRGAVNGTDGFYNTWSGDSLCAWFREAEKWLGDIGIIRTQTV